MQMMATDDFPPFGFKSTARSCHGWVVITAASVVRQTNDHSDDCSEHRFLFLELIHDNSRSMESLMRFPKRNRKQSLRAYLCGSDGGKQRNFSDPLD